MGGEKVSHYFAVRDLPAVECYREHLLKFGTEPQVVVELLAAILSRSIAGVSAFFNLKRQGLFCC